MKNYEQWNLPHCTWSSVEEFENQWNRSAGVHSITMPEGYVLDILANEHVDTADARLSLLVFFGAAVARREAKSGPFFSGVGLSNGCKLPLVAISDPSVDNFDSVNLAWYTGGAKQNFQRNVELLLRALVRATNRELLMSGGSGGGFAALHFSSLLGDVASAFVWNPQTDIFEYNEVFVKSYLREVFGFAHSSLARPDWKAFCRGRINQHVISSVAVESTIQNPHRILYLQNHSDWHTEGHLLPLLSTVSKDSLAAQKGSHVLGARKLVVIEDFAHGHAPPPTALITMILKQMIDPTVDPADVNLQLT